jgi:cysteine desulfuration protein SufE
MNTNFLNKRNQLESFLNESAPQKIYSWIISLSKNNNFIIPSANLDDSQIVKGCQSTLYLQCTEVDQNLMFRVSSDSLFSKGLAVMLCELYSNLPCDIIIKNNIDFIIRSNSLTEIVSVGRLNGAQQIYKKMITHAIIKSLTI